LLGVYIKMESSLGNNKKRSLVEASDDGLCKIASGGIATQVFRAVFALSNDLEDGLLDAADARFKGPMRSGRLMLLRWRCVDKQSNIARSLSHS